MKRPPYSITVSGLLEGDTVTVSEFADEDFMDIVYSYETVMPSAEFTYYSPSEYVRVRAMTKDGMLHTFEARLTRKAGIRLTIPQHQKH